MPPPLKLAQGQQSCRINLREFRFTHAAKAPHSLRLHSLKLMNSPYLM